MLVPIVSSNIRKKDVITRAVRRKFATYEVIAALRDGKGSVSGKLMNYARHFNVNARKMISDDFFSRCGIRSQ